jgi:hypothetical protein
MGWPKKLALLVGALIMGFFFLLSLGTPAPAYANTTPAEYWSAAAAVSSAVALKIVLPVWIIAIVRTAPFWK